MARGSKSQDSRRTPVITRSEMLCKAMHIARSGNRRINQSADVMRQICQAGSAAVRGGHAPLSARRHDLRAEKRLRVGGRFDMHDAAKRQRGLSLAEEWVPGR